jgi:hypothetical protein
VKVIAVFSVSKHQGLVSHGKAALSAYMKINSISREERSECSAFVQTEVKKKDALFKPEQNK